MEWDDAEEIAAAIIEYFPDSDPETTRLSELKSMVLDLPEFEGDAEDASEAALEAIHDAWLEQYEDQ